MIEIEISLARCFVANNAASGRVASLVRDTPGVVRSLQFRDLQALYTFSVAIILGQCEHLRVSSSQVRGAGKWPTWIFWPERQNLDVILSDLAAVTKGSLVLFVEVQ